MTKTWDLEQEFRDVQETEADNQARGEAVLAASNGVETQKFPSENLATVTEVSARGLRSPEGLGADK